jgi:hypothetical protein
VLKFSLFEVFFELALGLIKHQNLNKICCFTLLYEPFAIQMNEWVVIHTTYVGIRMQANTAEYSLH